MPTRLGFMVCGFSGIKPKYSYAASESSAEIISKLTVVDMKNIGMMQGKQTEASFL